MPRQKQTFRIERKPPRPVLAYDGQCALCRRCAAVGRRLCRGRVEFVPNAVVRDEFPEIPGKNFDESVVLIERDGSVSEGALATFRALAYGSKILGIPLWMYRHVPGFGAASEVVYHFVAKHRQSSDCRI